MIDEINLFDIFKIFARQKGFIISTTFLCTTVAIAMALLMPPTYRSEVSIMPPLTETIEKLNIPNIETNSEEDAEEYFFEVEPEDLYTELILNLQSSRLRKEFFDKHNLAQHLSIEDDGRSDNTIFQRGFNEQISIKGVAKKKEEQAFIIMTIDGKDPALIAEWLNGLILLADQTTIKQKNRAFTTKVRMVKNILSQKIESLRATEQSRRLDKIARLKEALAIATDLGWIQHPENPDVLYENAKLNGMDLSFSLQELPLYLRGTKALEAEIATLSNRKDDDPFIPELRNLQAKLNFISSVKQDTSNMHAMRLDQPAIADDNPVKPKKVLIVAVGFIMGLLLALAVALFRNALANEKAANSSK